MVEPVIGGNNKDARLKLNVIRQEDSVIARISIEAEVQQILSDAVRALPVTVNNIRDASQKDPVLQNIISCIRESWPQHLSAELRPSINRRMALSIVDSCVMFGDRVVIPTLLLPRVVRQFHNGHPRIIRMKTIADSYAYWPAMDI